MDTFRPEEESMYRNIFENMREVLYRCDNEERITLISPASLNMFGHDSLNDFMGKKIRDIFYHQPSDRDALAEELEKEGKVVNFPLVLKRKDGSTLYAKTTSYFLYDEQGKRMGLEGIIMDTSDQHKAEQALQQAADIVENINLGIYIYELEDPQDDRSLRLVAANPATEKFTGIPVASILGQSLDENFPGLRKKGIPGMFAAVVQTQKALEIEEMEYEDRRIPPGIFSVKAFPLPNQQVAVSLENITRRKQMEKELQEKNKELEKALKRAKEMHEQLVLSEKMASLGQITAGVAHEIKNPLGYIKANTGPLKRDLHDLLKVLERYESLVQAQKLEDRFYELESLKKELDFAGVVKEIHMLLDGIQEGADRTNRIVKSLGDFSRTSQDQVVMGDIHPGIDSTLILLSNQIGNRIRVIKEYGDLPDVEYYPGKLNQVFMNILANAVQAIEQKGEIVIRTGMDGDRVRISFTDSGKGMPEEVRKRIFEPFYTTKEVGEGTGLGLSICYHIISQHQGTIEVLSEPGKGTEFVITLPINQSVNLT